MLNVVVSENRILPMSDMDMSLVHEFEHELAKAPQIDIPTSHVFHAGMYSRTVMVPAGAVITGARIKLATLLIVSGDATVYIGNKTLRLKGYNVIPASASRKQAFLAHLDTYLTMIFPTVADSVAGAEEEFTDEAHRLMSKHCDNQTLITGE